MRKKIFLQTALFVLALTAANANAQTPNEFKAKVSTAETAPIKRQILIVFTKDKSLETFVNLPQTDAPQSSFKAENLTAPRRRQTYVRPTKEQRLKRYLSDAFGVPAVIGSTFGATINQIGNDPPEWRRSAGGFGKRFASSYATNAIRNTISYGLSETFKLDNRFEKSGQKNLGKRLKHVFLGSYTIRTRNSKRLPDFPQFVGTYSAAIIPNETWMPARFS